VCVECFRPRSFAEKERIILKPGTVFIVYLECFAHHLFILHRLLLKLNGMLKSQDDDCDANGRKLRHLLSLEGGETIITIFFLLQFHMRFEMMMVLKSLNSQMKNFNNKQNKWLNLTFLFDVDLFICEEVENYL
jgi:hypothetical protein